MSACYRLSIKTSIVDAFALPMMYYSKVCRDLRFITITGLINVDFADVKTIMSNAGSALMGIGLAKGDNRASEAAKTAVSSPLLETSIEGAKGVLLNITGSSNLGLFEINEAAAIVTEAADPDANIIFGAVIDEEMGDEIRVTVIATGFNQRKAERLGLDDLEIKSFTDTGELEVPAFLRKKG